MQLIVGGGGLRWGMENEQIVGNTQNMKKHKKSEQENPLWGGWCQSKWRHNTLRKRENWRKKVWIACVASDWILVPTRVTLCGLSRWQEVPLLLWKQHSTHKISPNFITQNIRLIFSTLEDSTPLHWWYPRILSLYSELQWWPLNYQRKYQSALK